MNTKEKLNILHESGKIDTHLKPIYFGDFMNEVLEIKDTQKQNYSYNSIGELRDKELEVPESFYTEKLLELADKETAQLDTKKVWKELNHDLEALVEQLYDDEIILNGCPHAIRGLSQADFM